MIIYLHGFDSTSPGNHEKVMQLKFADPDVRFISYSTLHPRYDMKYLLTEVDKAVKQSEGPAIVLGVGLGGFWAERVGYLCGIRQVMVNPNLFPYENMEGKIDRPEEYLDIMTKCISDFRELNRQNCLVLLSRNDEALDNQRAHDTLSPYYQVIWDEEQTHKFKDLSRHLQEIKGFKTAFNKA